MLDQTYPRNLRLLNSRDFRHVFDQTQWKVFCPGFLLLAAPGRTTETRIGFVFSKKNIRLAVRRNRFKRIFRDSFRRHHHQLPPVDILVLAIKEANLTSDQKLSKNLSRVWKQLNQRIGSDPI